MDGMKFSCKQVALLVFGVACFSVRPMAIAGETARPIIASPSSAATQSPRLSVEVVEISEPSQNVLVPAAAATRENGPSAEVAALLDRRSVSSITLVTSGSMTTTDGDKLRTPKDTAKEYYSEKGVSGDVAVVLGDVHQRRCLYRICHNPLYFEDPNMERCGQGFGVLTEAVSAARFFGRIPLVPYMMGATPPCECVRALPNCPSCHRFGCDAYVPDPTIRAVSLQGIATVGFIFLIP